MIKDLKDFENKIDKLNISPIECDTLLKMLNNMSPEMFAKSMEEIVEGNLKISDFTDILSDTNYTQFLKSSIPEQYNLSRQITAYNKLLNQTPSGTPDDMFFKNMLGIDGKYLKTILDSLDGDGEKQNKIRKFYEDEIEEIRKDIIYSLSLDHKSDSVLQVACKNILLNELLKAQGDDKIDPLEAASLLFSIDEYILPISAEYQTITDADRYFMSQNNISEDLMKKIKATAIFLRRETIK